MAASQADAQEILLQHGEKIALGVALAIAVGVFVTAGSGGADKATAIKKHRGTIEGKMNKGVPDSEKPEVPTPLKTALEPWGAKTADIRDDLPWTYYRLPGVEITTTVGPPPVVVTELPKTGINATASRESIDLGWQQPASNGIEPGTTKTRSRANLWGYELHKWRKGAPEKITKKFFGPGSNGWRDTDFEPETTYVYKVRAFFEFERPGDKFEVSEVKGGTEGVVEGGNRQGQKVRFTNWTDTTSVTTALNIGLSYRSRLGDTATIYVWQFWKGFWWRVDFKVEIGSDVGAMVTPKMLTSNSYNSSNRSGDAAYQELQAAAKGDNKADIPWKSGYVYLGHMREKREDYVLLEHQEVAVRGMFGLDWGQKHVRLKKTDGDTPPEN